MRVLIAVIASFLLLSACESDRAKWERSTRLWCEAMYTPEDGNKFTLCPEYYIGNLAEKFEEIDAEKEFKKAHKICEEHSDDSDYRGCMQLMFASIFI